MKKLFLCIISIILCMSVCFADISIGVRGGLSYGIGTSLKEEQQAIKTGEYIDNFNPAATMSLNIPFAKIFFIQPEVGCQYNGKTHSISTLLNKTEIVYSYLTLDIPILFGVEFSGFNLFAGVNLSLPLDKIELKSKSTTGGITIEDKATFPLKTALNIGAVAGFGYTLRLGFFALVIDARYIMDFSPLYINFYGDDYTEYLTRKAASLTAGIQYYL